MYNEQQQSFLGKGWAFPPRFDDQNQIAQMVEEEEDIAESLHILLSTSPGERVMRPEFGCDLQRIVFERIDESTLAQIRDLIAFSILHFEPRITLETVDVDTSDYLGGLLRIMVVYTIRSINVRTNIVYPFYFTEGTNITEE